MIIRITASPIDVAHQKVYGIYENSEVKDTCVGKILKALVKRGHTNIQSHYSEVQDCIYIHCNVDRDKIGVFRV